jgi:hypothetical protein
MKKTKVRMTMKVVGGKLRCYIRNKNSVKRCPRTAQEFINSTGGS